MYFFVVCYKYVTLAFDEMKRRGDVVFSKMDVPVAQFPTTGLHGMV